MWGLRGSKLHRYVYMMNLFEQLGPLMLPIKSLKNVKYIDDQQGL